MDVNGDRIKGLHSYHQNFDHHIAMGGWKTPEEQLTVKVGQALGVLFDCWNRSKHSPLAVLMFVFEDRLALIDEHGTVLQSHNNHTNTATPEENERVRHAVLLLA